MKLYIEPPKNLWGEITKRPEIDNQEIKESVRLIIEEIREKGDASVKKYAKFFDRVDLNSLYVSQEEIDNSSNECDESLKNAIIQAKNNIEKFHSCQVKLEDKVEISEGIECWRKMVPIPKVGLYIPGGSAPLFSTVLMLATPAMVAGCKDVIIATPCGKDGKINPAILFAAKISGVSKILKVGGVQAIASLAYGTESVEKVDKIFGPGNQFVTAAKMHVNSDGVAIDMPAGPSEVLVYADDKSNPEFVASDILSQCEHGSDSQAVLVAESKSFVSKVAAAIEKQLENLDRTKLINDSLANSISVVFEDKNDAISFVNMYASEHLIISTDSPEEDAELIYNAGSVFIGPYSPESAGDYASGTNHTLPTNGYARAYSGVSTDSFMKSISFQKLSKTGLESIADTVTCMASAENLEAHKRAVEIRLEN